MSYFSRRLWGGNWKRLTQKWLRGGLDWASLQKSRIGQTHQKSSTKQNNILVSTNKVHISSDRIVIVFCVHFERDRRGFRARKSEEKFGRSGEGREKKGKSLHRSHRRPTTTKSSLCSTVRDQLPQKAHFNKVQ